MLKKKQFSLEEACQSPNLFVNLAEVIQTHPCEAARIFGMSIISSFNGKNEESLEYLELLAQDNPDMVLLHQRIAESCIYFEEYEKAVVHLKKVIDLENENLTARFWLCLTYCLLGETGKAKGGSEYFRKLVHRLQVKTKTWQEDQPQFS